MKLDSNPWLVDHMQIISNLMDSGDFEQSLSHCCRLGTEWGQENLKCTSFPAPVVGIANEQQAVCLSAVHICCLRKHR